MGVLVIFTTFIFQSAFNTASFLQFSQIKKSYTMKHKTFTLYLLTGILICLLTNISSLIAQPQAVSYQAIARDNSGNILANQPISLRFTIRDNTAGGAILYRETHNLSTSSLGSFSVNIGQGTVVQGTFTSINWGVNNKFMQVEMDAAGGSTYVSLGTQQMLSVPYSLFAANAAGGWSLTGNSGTVDGTNFIGTIDNVPLNFKVGSLKAGRIDYTLANTFLGGQSGNAITSGNHNTAIGHSSLLSNTVGARNVAVGESALETNVGGGYATAVGYQAQYYAYNSATPTNLWNTSVGAFALRGSLTPASNTGFFNTAIGAQSMSNNSSGAHCAAVGSSALTSNTTGNFNTATGREALLTNTTGNSNAAFGYQSLYSNLSGIRNTGSGEKALYSCTGSDNAGFGVSTLNNTTTSNYNTAIGSFAGAIRIHGQFNTFLGHSATASANSFSNSTAVGDNSTVTASNQVRVGNGTVTSVGAVVGWTTVSDARFKRNIQTNVRGLDFILELNPVTYNLDVSSIDNFLGRDFIEKETGIVYTEEEKNEIATSRELKEKTVYSGFLAQDVEAIAKKLGYDFSGIDAPKNENDFYGLRYGDFVVPLVKAVQEQQAIIESQNQKLDQMQAVNLKLLEETASLKSDIEIIKAELGLNRMVSNVK